VIKTIVSWAIALWACKIFLFSLPYKFTRHPDTEHIFSTIGAWLGGFLGDGIGQFFSNFGAYIVGSFELITSIVLLLPVVMAGAVFFHVFSPLGIEVLHEGESDNGSLFYAALSILVLGVVLFFINVGDLRRTAINSQLRTS